MKRISLLWLLTAFSLLFLEPTFAKDLPRLRGNVTRVIDGDTLDVQLSSGPIRVRLYGVDAPEKKQAFGMEAKESLERLVKNKAVEIQPESQDRYSRIVGIVFSGKTNVNTTMVEQGSAWAYRRYLHKSDSNYCRLEYSARSGKRGLWKTDARAPWQFRRKGPFTDFSRETEASCIASLSRSK
jgi:endonuclease YncB( thermonuclease family)